MWMGNGLISRAQWQWVLSVRHISIQYLNAARTRNNYKERACLDEQVYRHYEDCWMHLHVFLETTFFMQIFVLLVVFVALTFVIGCSLGQGSLGKEILNPSKTYWLNRGKTK